MQKAKQESGLAWRSLSSHFFFSLDLLCLGFEIRSHDAADDLRIGTQPGTLSPIEFVQYGNFQR